MTELQKEINTAFGIINAITVTGENQERAVMAKEHLRRAYKLAGEGDTDGEQDDQRA